MYLIGKPSDAVSSHLKSGDWDKDKNECVIIKEYGEFLHDLTNVLQENEEKILLSKPWAYTGNINHTAILIFFFKGGASFAIYDAVDESKRLLGLSPIMFRKAQKNNVEIKGMENANLKDAVALIAFSAELEEGMINGDNWDELKVSKRLYEYRSKQELFQVK